MHGDGLLLGWESERSAFGFESNPPPGTGDALRYRGEAPITVIAPTGSGKGVSILVPLLLTYPGPIIAIDLKGELSAVAGRRRSEMGHLVSVIDPFGITGRTSDRIDPFELFRIPGSQLECDAEMLASMLSVGHQVEDDPFWDDAGASLIAGLIAYAASACPKDESGLSLLRKYLFNDDTVYQIAVLLDTNPRMNRFAKEQLAGFLSHADNQTRPCVLAVARTFMRSLNSPPVTACLESPTVGLKDIQEGVPLDVFLTIPPEKIMSHAGLLRMLIGVLMATVMRRREIPEFPTLFVIDEAAQLGHQFEPLLLASTLLRGYGLQLVTAWQDVAQIKGRYRHDWQTILNNSGAVISFGFGHYAAAKDGAELFGMETGELLRMKPDEAVVAVRGEGVRKVRRLNYLKDEMFEGMFDPNPYYRRRAGPGK